MKPLKSKPSDAVNPRIRLSRRRLRLSDVDLDQAVAGKSVYEQQKQDLQKRLLQIQQAYLMQGRRAVIVMEGWDAAGKGGAIRRLTEKLDPRVYKVWPVSAPNEAEKAQHFLQRFWVRVPSPGAIAIFDRSWYGRVLVERVEKLITAAELERAYREINEFEAMLMQDGVRVVKLFFHVSPQMQLERLIERAETPFKRWKLSVDDFRNRGKWQDYHQAIDDMLARTSSIDAPWHLLASDWKWFSRLQTLKITAERLSRGVALEAPPLDPQVKKLLKQAARRGAKRP